MHLDYKKIQTFLLLSFLIISAFGMHLKVFSKSLNWSIDEGVYYTLGWQLQKNPKIYNTILHAKILEKESPELAPLPDYFRDPLFKHPPLFSYLVALNIKIFGEETVFSCIPSALFGALTILLAYFFGKLFFSRRVGLLAAVGAWLDPILTMCSQKIWMDTTLGFFIALSILLYAYGIQKNEGKFFFWAGISAGLAILTKYNGVLALGTAVLYTLIYRRDLFKNRHFLFSLITPFLMLSPWILWNTKVYGNHFFTRQLLAHGLTLESRSILKIMLIGAVTLLLITIVHFIRQHFWKDRPEEANSVFEDKQSHPFWRRCGMIWLGLILVLGLWENLIKGLSPFHIPITSWKGDVPGSWHPSFYFGRLIEFSLIYLFAFVSFFIYQEKRSYQGALLYIGSIVILLFHVGWGDYQSRYIISGLPLLLVLGIGFLDELAQKFLENKNPLIRKWGITLLGLVLGYAFLKMTYINLMLSLTNDMCYF